MKANKYGTSLTVALIILIVVILIGLGFLVYGLVKSNLNDKQAQEAIAQFDNNVGQSIDEAGEKPAGEGNGEEIESSQPSNTEKRKTYFQGFVMIGYIKIPETGIELPILDEVTPDSLNTSVAALYPSNPQDKLNQPGNVVIIGHNYRNGKFFSNNEKLSVGDKIYIKDINGTQLEYTIYEKFETTPQDTSFYTRDTNGAIEVTLSTCTDDSSARIIILARVEA